MRCRSVRVEQPPANLGLAASTSALHLSSFRPADSPPIPPQYTPFLHDLERGSRNPWSLAETDKKGVEVARLSVLPPRAWTVCLHSCAASLTRWAPSFLVHTCHQLSFTFITQAGFTDNQHDRGASALWQHHVGMTHLSLASTTFRMSTTRTSSHPAAAGLILHHESHATAIQSTT